MLFIEMHWNSNFWWCANVIIKSIFSYKPNAFFKFKCALLLVSPFICYKQRSMLICQVIIWFPSPFESVHLLSWNNVLLNYSLYIHKEKSHWDKCQGSMEFVVAFIFNSAIFSWDNFELCGFVLSICSQRLIDLEKPAILSAEAFRCGSISVTKYFEVSVVFFRNTLARTNSYFEKVVKNITFSSLFLCLIFVGLNPPYVHNPSG